MVVERLLGNGHLLLEMASASSSRLSGTSIRVRATHAYLLLTNPQYSAPWMAVLTVGIIEDDRL
jgi:hypothetical protein